MPKFADQLVDIVGDGALVVSADRLGGIADPAHIGRDDGVARGERGNNLAPFVPGLRPSVQQHDRLALPAMT